MPPRPRLAFLVVLATTIGGCCNDVDETLCIEWPEPTSCPTRDEATASLHVEVRSDATFWPSREYLIDGRKIVEPAECCYEVTVTQCTTELH